MDGVEIERVDKQRLKRLTSRRIIEFDKIMFNKNYLIKSLPGSINNKNNSKWKVKTSDLESNTARYLRREEMNSICNLRESYSVS